MFGVIKPFDYQALFTRLSSETEALTRTTAVPAQVVTSRAMFTLAAMARAG